jgi:hypothetical protein
MVGGRIYEYESELTNGKTYILMILFVIFYYKNLCIFPGIDVLAKNDANKRLLVKCGAFDVLLKSMKRDDLPVEQLGENLCILM